MKTKKATQDWYTFRRTHYPLMRRHSPVGIVRNGASKRVYECICGAQISMCAKWPITVRVMDFHVAHDDCRTLPREGDLPLHARVGL